MSQIKCQAFIKNKSPKLCSRNAESRSNYCWQHADKENIIEEQKLNYNLVPDTELLMYSYLPLEEILTIFKDDLIMRNKILKIYPYELPSIEVATLNGDLETLKYLVSLGIKLKPVLMEMASQNGHLEIVKYLVSIDVKPTSDAINYASANGHLEIIKYLVSLGVKPRSKAIDDASTNGYLEIVKYLYSIGVVPTSNAINFASGNGHLEIVKYLYSIGAVPTSNAMDFATRNGHLETINFLKSIGVQKTTIANNEYSNSFPFIPSRYQLGVRPPRSSGK
jgi:ankyrin repeat protein